MGDLVDEPGVDQAVPLNEAVLLLALAGRLPRDEAGLRAPARPRRGGSRDGGLREEALTDC